MISEPLGRQFDVGAPERTPSAARLAAEAFFAPRGAPVPAEPAPEVVVKKRRLEEPQRTTDEGASGTREPARETRVFRLTAPLAIAVVTEAKVHEALTGAEATARHQVGQVQATSVPVRRARGHRKKQDPLHGEVTILRPAAPPFDVVRSLEPNATSSFQPALASDPSTTGEVSGVELPSGAGPRYLALRRQLLSLQAQAQEAKRCEAQAALVWIHQAIGDYDITPGDLGFSA